MAAQSTLRFGNLGEMKFCPEDPVRRASQANNRFDVFSVRRRAVEGELKVPEFFEVPDVTGPGVVATGEGGEPFERISGPLSGFQAITEQGAAGAWRSANDVTLP